MQIYWRYWRNLGNSIDLVGSAKFILYISICRFISWKAHIYADLFKQRRVWEVSVILKNAQMYTRVSFMKSAYIRRFSERKARMNTRVCWSTWYEMSDLFCCFTAICQWCIHIDLGFLNVEYVADYDWLKIKFLVVWLKIQWVNWWGYEFQFDVWWA